MGYVFCLSSQNRCGSRGASIKVSSMENYCETQQTWRASRFNVSVDLPGDRVAVYNTFSTALFTLDFALWRRFLDANESGMRHPKTEQLVWRQLCDKGFIVPIGMDEIEQLRLRFNTHRYHSDTLIAIVAPTLQCNLECEYCFERSLPAQKRAGVMKDATADATVRYLGRMLSRYRTLHISWFGGEPLLAMGAIERITAALQPAVARTGRSYTADIVTNATLLSESLVERLIALDITGMQVTLDVPWSAKKLKRGNSAIPNVLDGLKMAAGRIPVGVRLNVVADSEIDFDALYDALLRDGLHAQVANVHFARTFPPECREMCGPFKPLPQQLFADIVARETRKANSLGIPIHEPYGSYDGCTGTSVNSVVIDPDGLVYKCPADIGNRRRAFTSLHAPGLTDDAALLPWLKYDWFSFTECSTCNLLPQCAGGCPHQRLFASQHGMSTGDFCKRDSLEGLSRFVIEISSRSDRGNELHNRAVSSFLKQK